MVRADPLRDSRKGNKGRWEGKEGMRHKGKRGEMY